LSRPI